MRFLSLLQIVIKNQTSRLSRQPHRRNKIVILSHDVAHQPNSQRDEQASLQEFIRLAKESGYKFDTLDNY